jgi:diguanylate cyclase (GGDEF)-like protein/PAS domain S-box-containing protein
MAGPKVVSALTIDEQAGPGGRMPSTLEGPVSELFALLEIVPDAQLVLAGDGRIRAANARAELLFGYGPGQLGGAPVQRLIPGGVRPDSPSARLDLAARRRDGSEFQAEVSLSAVDTAEGRMIIAAVREARSASGPEPPGLREDAEMMEAQRLASIGSWTWDPGANTARWSAEMYRIFGLDPGDGPLSDDAFFAYVHPDDRERVARDYHRLLDGGDLVSLDFRIVRPDGEERALTARGHRDPASEGVFVGAIQDVTAQRAVERELREQSELLAGLIDNAPIGQSLTSVDGRWLRVNRALCEILGYSAEELIELGREALTHPDDLAGDEEAIRAMIAGELGTPHRQQRYLRKDGEVVWAMVSTTLVRDEHGAPSYFIGQVEDITERKRVQDLLIQRDRQLSEAQQLARLGTWEWELSESRAKWSDEACRIFGQPLGFAPTYEEFLALVHPDDRAIVDDRVRGVGAEVESETGCRIVLPGGEVRHVHLRRFGRVGDDGEIHKVLGTVQDVTKLREAEQRVRDRERQLEEAQRVAHFGSWEYEIAADRLRWSDEMCRIAGREPGFSPTFEEFLSLVHPDDRAAVFERAGAAQAQHENDSEYRIVLPDGQVRYVHTRRFARTAPDGAVTHIWGTSQDITERIEREHALEIARDHSETIITAMREGYCLTVDGKISAVNDAVCELTGFSREDLIGAGMPFPFWGPETVEQAMVIRDQIVAAEGGTFELTLTRKDGSKFEAEITAQRASNPDGTMLGLVNTVRDISERKRYEAELERLAATDSLTGLANHRAFHERLEHEAARANRHGRSLSVAVLDLDYFKEVNDAYGHPVGDEVLREVAERLKTLPRSGELIARVGGEEFAWLLPDADADGALAAADRARKLIGESDIPPIGSVTLSAGICDLAHAADVHELYQRADQALYRAKRLGRNRVVRYGQSTPAG